MQISKDKYLKQAKIGDLKSKILKDTHTHTHTHTYIYIYIYVCVCVCVCVCTYVR